MVDLARLESAKPPRPPEVCKKYVSRIDPLWGFAIYGVLWAVVAYFGFAIGCIPGFALGYAVGAKGALWVTILGLAGGAVGFALAWIPFVRWARRKRAKSLPLIRDGALVEGRVFDPSSQSNLDRAKRLVGDYVVGQIGVKVVRITLEHDGVSRMVHAPAQSFTARPSPGTALPVLFHASSKYVLVFDERGKAIVASVHGQ